MTKAKRETPKSSSKDTLKAIKVCRRYQLELRQLLIQIEKDVMESDKLQSKVAGFIQLSNKKLLVQRYLVDFPFFVDSSSGTLPPPNTESLLFSQLSQTFPITHTIQQWTKSELSALRDGVLHCSRISRAEQLLASISESPSPDLIERAFSMVTASPSENSETSAEPLSAHEMDWERISTHFCPSHSPAECKRMWVSTASHPENNSKWTKAESGQLVALVQEIGQRDWDLISQRISTPRTAFQCFQRFQQSHNSSLLRREFTAAEDEQLVQLVSKFGPNWDEISNWMEDRIPSQLNHRYNNTCVGGLRHGCWSLDEDLRLVVGRKALGRWSLVAGLVAGRTGVKCRERFVNVLDPSNTGSKGKRWSRVEDERLRELVGRFGAGKWSRISKEMGATRNDNQIYRRWRTNVASAEELKAYENRLVVERELSITNFVGRKHHRPDIDGEVFLELLGGDDDDDDDSTRS